MARNLAVLPLILLLTKNALALDYAEVKGTYRLDVDSYIKINKALDFSLWSKSGEGEVKKEIGGQLETSRVVFEDKRVIEATEAEVAKGNAHGQTIKVITDDGGDACMVMTITVLPTGPEMHSFIRIFKKNSKLFMSKMLLGQEVIYPLVKVDAK